MGRPRKPTIDESKEEFCNCGHMKILHTDTGFWSNGDFVVIGENHACCIVNRCICSKFTWLGVGTKNLIENLDPTKTSEFTKEDWEKIDKAVMEANN